MGTFLRSQIRRLFYFIFGATCLLLPGQMLHASPGNLDFDFGLGGIADPDVGILLGNPNPSEFGRAVAVYPQGGSNSGKIVVAGLVGNFDSQDFCAARYNPDGSLDTTFGTVGAVEGGFTEANSTGPSAQAVLIQPDGKVVLAGNIGSTFSHNKDFALVRFCPDGTLDDGVNCGAGGFGTGGRVTTDVGGNDGEDEIAGAGLQPDGKIVVAGSSPGDDPLDFAVARYCPDGKLDDGVNCGAGGFGNGGVAISNLGGGQNEGQAMAIQSDGKIVVVGFADDFNATDFGVARFCPNGSPDDGSQCSGNFNGSGFFTFSLNGEDFARAVAIQSDGKILVAGNTSVDISSTDDIAVARLCPDGGLDDGSTCGAGGFGSGGSVIGDFSGDGSSSDIAYAVQVQADGKILVGGITDDGGDDSFFVSRLLTSGDPDFTFGASGTVIQTLDFSSGTRALAIQSEGKVLAAGTSGSNFTVIRLIGDSADLSIENQASVPTAAVGDTITFTLTVTNNSSISVSSVEVVNHLPSMVTLVSAPDCTGTTDLTCTIGTLGPNAAAASIVITVTAAAEGVAANSAEVFGAVTDLDPSNNEATAFTVVGAQGGSGGGGGNGGGGGGSGEVCGDGVDNDLDGAVDCSDPDCFGNPACPNSPGIGGGSCALNPTVATGSFPELGFVLLLLGAGLSLRLRMHRLGRKECSLRDRH